MRASLAIALLTTVVAAGTASAQSSYPCTETNDTLPNPHRLVADRAASPRQRASRQSFLSTSGFASMTTERRRVPSGHWGWLSAQTIPRPRLAGFG
jgi:hypothetical protein